MNITEYRSQFTIFLLTPDLVRGTEVRGRLSELGYDTYAFIEQDVLETRLSELPPHVLLFSLEGLQSSIKEFIEHVMKTSPETLMIPVGTSEQVQLMHEYSQVGVQEYVVEDGNLTTSIEWAVDRAVEKLCYIFQNEQLLSESEEAQQLLSQERVRLQEYESKLEKTLVKADRSDSGLQRLSTLQERLRRSASKEEMIQAYLSFCVDELQNADSAFYLRFLPQVLSVVVTHSAGLSHEKIKGVGFKLEAEEIRSLPQTLLQAQNCQSMKNLMNKGFQSQKYRTRTLAFGEEIEGVMVELGVSDETGYELIEEMAFESFRLSMELLHTRKRLQDVETKDEVTQLLTSFHFGRRVDEEIARAKRIRLPLSLIRIQIDHLDQLRAELGDAGVDMVLRAVSALISKNTRVNDIVAKTGEAEISILLPHTSLKGAAVRAEKIRRLVESTVFSFSSRKLTLSAGVGEYPSMSSSAEELAKSAALALKEVLTKGGNKVCLAAPPKNFQPEFSVSQSS